MARAPRPQAARIYHITASSIRSQLLFLDDRDRHLFLLLFARVCERYKWKCLAYCLMGTHYHLLIDVPEGTLSAGCTD